MMAQRGLRVRAAAANGASNGSGGAPRGPVAPAMRTLSAGSRAGTQTQLRDASFADMPRSEPQGLVRSRNSPQNGQVMLRQKLDTRGELQAVSGELARVVAQRNQDAIDVEATDAPLLLDTDFRWARDDYSKVRRTVDVWVFFGALRSQLWLLDQKWTYAGGFSEEKKSVRMRSLAIYIRETILDLGPTFIKIGQLFSTRSDILGPEFIEELAQLQDRVPAFAPKRAMDIIERELGAPVSKLFRSFEERPIAAASLGQVHRAQLWSGEEVVVKVQRPGLKALFDIDLENLRILAEQLDRGDEDNRDFKGIYEECATILYEEIDYINEGRNADRFRRNFAATPYVKVPTVYWSYTSPRVIALEYLPGVKISARDQLSSMGLDVKLIARQATEAYLDQILTYGFFHADPHPGNLHVDTEGKIVYYDFGMMGEIVPTIRENLTDVFYGIYKQDVNKVIDSLVTLEVIKATGDLLSLRRAIGYFIDNLFRQTAENETVAAIGEDLFAIAVDQPFRFPATFTFVLRSFSTLEGIGKALDEDYQFSEVAQPFGEELLNLKDTSAQQRAIVEELQTQATEFSAAATAMPLRVAKIENTLRELEEGNFRPRVRVLEAERSARREALMSLATMNTVTAVGMLNVGTMLALNELTTPATVALLLAAVGAVGVVTNLKRVQRLDKFEKQIR